MKAKVFDRAADRSSIDSFANHREDLPVRGFALETFESTVFARELKPTSRTFFPECSDKGQDDRRPTSGSGATIIDYIDLHSVFLFTEFEC